MSKHFCFAKSVTDLLTCDICGDVCCAQCFSIKHIGEDKMIHPSKKLVDSDLYRNFLRLLHVEWLIGQKLLKSMGSFQITEINQTYIVNNAFYGSQFYKELFSNESIAQEYLILKCWCNNDPKSFENLSGLSKLLNDSKTFDIISKYITKLTEPTEQEKVMNSHLDFYTGADIYYLAEFISYEQTAFYNYIKELSKTSKEFSIYQYIEKRQKSTQIVKNQTFYSNEFTVFLVEYYRKDSGSKDIFTLQDYVLNFWEFFSSTVLANQTLKEFLESEVAFYKQYEKLMVEQKMTITLLGFKLWKLNYGVSKQLPYLKNHYFLLTFINGFLQMLIERTYAFFTNEEKQEMAKQTYLDFIRFIKDFSILIQSRNASLENQNKQILDFAEYRTYYSYRKKFEKFHSLLKASKENIYDKEVAVKFFNFYFGSNIQFKPKLYKEFFEKQEEEKRLKQQKIQKEVQELKIILKQEQKDEFYEFVFINFVAYCREQDIAITKETYEAFKKSVKENMDEDYLRLTEEKFKRGDFNEEVEEVTEEKTEEPLVTTIENGVKVTIGMDKFEEEILEENIHEADEQQQCPCCHDDYYNCENPECSLMGYCVNCGEI